MSEVVPPTTFMEVFSAVMAIGIGIALMLAILVFIVNQIQRAFLQSIREDHAKERDRQAAMVKAYLFEKSKHEEKPKLKNDDLEFEGEDYFEEDEYSTFEELLAENPKRKNDDYE